VVVKMRVVGSADEARHIRTSSLMHRITEVGCERVNICQNIWSLLEGSGVNFTGEEFSAMVGTRLGNGLRTNQRQTLR